MTRLAPAETRNHADSSSTTLARPSTQGSESSAEQRRVASLCRSKWRGRFGGGLGKTQDGLLGSADIDYIGGHDFQGVWNGRDYPLFAIDRLHSDPVNVATKVIDGPSVSGRSRDRALPSCIEDADWPSAIYLPYANSPAMKRTPPVDPLDSLKVDNQMTA